MVELTRAERRSWRERLEKRQSIVEFGSAFDELDEHLGLHSVTQHGIEFFRDAWIALAMGRSLGADEIHLVSDLRPDFALGWKGLFSLFEATEADRPGRRRGDEFKRHIAMYGEGAKLTVHVPYESGMTANQAAEWLTLAAEKKADSRYKGEYGLVILLQPTDFNQWSDDVVKCFPEATEFAAPHFDGVWVLWKGTAWLAWPAEKPLPRI